MNYENLLIEAETNEILVKEADLITKDGLCKGNRIAISKSLLTDSQRRCVLIEELGHYYKTVGDITDQSKTSNKKQEIIARRWGYEKLVGIVDLINAHNHGCRNKFEVADYLNITEEFLEEVLEYYKCKYPEYCEIDNYFIFFNNGLNVLEKF